jgi:hypothetical protein
MRSTCKAIAVTTRRRVRSRVLNQGKPTASLLLLHAETTSTRDQHTARCVCCFTIALLVVKQVLSALYCCTLQPPNVSWCCLQIDHVAMKPHT